MLSDILLVAFTVFVAGSAIAMGITIYQLIRMEEYDDRSDDQSSTEKD